MSRRFPLSSRSQSVSCLPPPSDGSPMPPTESAPTMITIPSVFFPPPPSPPSPTSPLPPANPPSPTNPSHPKKGDRFKLFRVSLAVAVSISAGAALLSSAAGTYFAVRRHLDSQVQQQQLALLQRAQSYQQTEDFALCISYAEQVLPASPSLPRARLVLMECRNAQAWLMLDEANQFAERGELAKAIALANAIPPSSSRAIAQQLVLRWSTRMMEIGRDYYYSSTNQFNAAIATLHAIPAGSPLYSEAQTTLQQWQTEWAANAQHWQDAQTALEQDDLTTAQQAVMQISQHPFWASQSQPLRQAIATKAQDRRYAQLVREAETRLGTRQPDAAIALAQQLPDQAPWLDRKTQLLSQARQQRWLINGCRTLSLGLFCY
ncbi:MAG TPA: hypothetical protein V6C88_01210 [Chroococcidiopsis sp.]